MIPIIKEKKDILSIPCIFCNQSLSQKNQRTKLDLNFPNIGYDFELYCKSCEIDKKYHEIIFKFLDDLSIKISEIEIAFCDNDDFYLINYAFYTHSSYHQNVVIRNTLRAKVKNKQNLISINEIKDYINDCILFT